VVAGYPNNPEMSGHCQLPGQNEALTADGAPVPATTSADQALCLPDPNPEGVSDAGESLES
jgi:hypothetical protein